LIDDLVAANRILYDQGVVDGFGHVSGRHDKNPERFLLARSMAPGLVTAVDMMEFDLAGDPIDPQGRTPYLERFIHSEIYKAYPAVQAIVHSHSPAVIPFGVVGTSLRPIFHMGSFLGLGVPVFEIREAGGMTDMLVSNAKFGRALAEKLGDKAAILMRGHGFAATGKSLPYVVGRSIYIGVAAKLQAEAIALGGTVTYLDPEEGRKIEARRDYIRPWELWKAQAQRHMTPQ